MSESDQVSRERFVVGVDGSTASAQALRWAQRHAAKVGAELVVVTAVFPAVASFQQVLDAEDAAPGEREHDAQLRDQLGAFVRESVGEVPARLMVARGHPASVLRDLSKDADLLVVGSRGYGGFAGALLGSVSHHVVGHAACPVVVVRD